MSDIITKLQRAVLAEKRFRRDDAVLQPFGINISGLSIDILLVDEMISDIISLDSVMKSYNTADLYRTCRERQLASLVHVPSPAHFFNLLHSVKLFFLNIWKVLKLIPTSKSS